MRCRRASRPALDRAEILAVDVLHDEEVLLVVAEADVEDLRDVAVLEQRQHLRLGDQQLDEARVLREVRQDALDRDGLLEAARRDGLPSEDLGHAADADAVEQLVPSHVPATVAWALPSRLCTGSATLVDDAARGRPRLGGRGVGRRPRARGASQLVRGARGLGGPGDRRARVVRSRVADEADGDGGRGDGARRATAGSISTRRSAAICPAAASTGTVGQLLGHAAGCAAHVEFWKRTRAAGSARPLVATGARARPPRASPASRAVYSDLGYITAGAVVERCAGQPLEDAYAEKVARAARNLARDVRGRGDLRCAGAVATERDARGLVCGRVHDENAYYGGGVCGHAGLFATIDDVARFAAAIVDAASGHARGRLRPEIVARFLTTACAPDASWRLGWDTPSRTPGVSHAGDRWPRDHAVGHLGFTGTSLWLDLPRRRWVALLTNRVHPTRDGTADAIKVLRRAVAERGARRNASTSTLFSIALAGDLLVT